MAGKLGTDFYSEYTVIGDEVNLTSRIEAFSLRGQVLISDSTLAHCRDFATVGEGMDVFVKGKSRPVRLHELLEIPSRQLKVPRQDLRRSRRVEVKVPCTINLIQGKIVLPHSIRATIRDIGYHGILIESDHPLRVHDEVKLDFELPLIDFRVTDVYAKVVKAKSSGELVHAGSEFTAIHPEANMKLQLFVQLLVSAEA